MALPPPPDLDALVHPRRRVGPIVAVVGVALTLALGCGVASAVFVWKRNTGGVAPTAQVERRDIEVVVSTTGELEAIGKVEVGSEVSGKVLRVLVKDNDRVTVGQVLAEIDPADAIASRDEAQAQVRTSRASLAQAQADLDQSVAAWERAQAQLAKGLVTQADHDAARATWRRAKASVDSARASVDLQEAKARTAAQKVERTTIVSPLDGVVLSRKVEPGQTVTAGFTTPVVFELALDLGTLRLVAAIDESDIGPVVAGQTATFTVPAFDDRTFQAVVTDVLNVGAEVDGVVTFEARLEAPNPEGVLRPGMTATVNLEVARKTQVAAVSWEAVRYIPAGADPGTDRALWTSATERVPVKLGATDEVWVELIDGPPVGTTVWTGDPK